MFQGGQIYYLTDFKESPGGEPKNRYCIVLSVVDDGRIIVFHKVTSEPYCDKNSLKFGGNKVDENKDVYFIPKGMIVGKNGFSFDRDSYVHMGVWNISEWSSEKFLSFNHELKDELLDETYNNLLYFIYRSDHKRQKYETIFEPILEELNNQESDPAF